MERSSIILLSVSMVIGSFLQNVLVKSPAYAAAPICLTSDLCIAAGHAVNRFSVLDATHIDFWVQRTGGTDTDIASVTINCKTREMDIMTLNEASLPYNYVKSSLDPKIDNLCRTYGK